MDWTEVKININSKDVETAGNIAQMVVPYGIYIEDYSDLEQAAWEIAHIDLIDEELLNKDRRLYTSTFLPKKTLPRRLRSSPNAIMQRA